jgi:hypothetical protein
VTGESARAPQVGTLKFGGPDGFGYVYVDSDQPGGPSFNWQDIHVTGTQVALTGDDAISGALPIGFTFPFYSASFTTFHICTNGWISFTNGSLTTYTDHALPDAGAQTPENLIAPFWDDLDFGATPRAYYKSNGSQLVIQYQAVPRAEEPSLGNSFEVILRADGTIRYQYLSMASTVLTSCTIGIQNATRDTGLQVVSDAAYMHGDLAVEFHRPAPGFMSVSPRSGVVTPGNHLDLTVTFDATDLTEGIYSGFVVIASNDAEQPVRAIPCKLITAPVGDLGVGDGSAVARFGLRFAGRNPASDGARVELEVPTRGHADVRVFDVRGALVAELARREFEPGRHALEWNGIDAAGHRAGTGMYFIRADTPAGRFTLRFALLR